MLDLLKYHVSVLHYIGNFLLQMIEAKIANFQTG